MRELNLAEKCSFLYNDPELRSSTVNSEFEYMVAVCRRMANKGHGQHTFHDIGLEGNELQELVKLMQDEGFTVKAKEFLCKFSVRWDGHEFPAERTYGFGAKQ